MYIMLNQVAVDETDSTQVLFRSTTTAACTSLERRFESHIINARSDRTRYRSLTDTQLQIVRTLNVAHRR